jgi:hypothetical protein
MWLMCVQEVDVIYTGFSMGFPNSFFVEILELGNSSWQSIPPTNSTHLLPNSPEMKIFLGQRFLCVSKIGTAKTLRQKEKWSFSALKLGLLSYPRPVED